MRTYADHFLQPEPTNWHIWSMLLCVTVLMAMTGFTSHLDGRSPAPIDESIDAADTSDSVLPIPDASPAMKCAQCGVVSSLREIESGAAKAGLISPRDNLGKSYEVTVQMRNGSRHVFRDVGPSMWRVGERMIVIGGV